MKKILFRGFHVSESGEECIKIDGKVYRGEWVEGYAIQQKDNSFIGYIESMDLFKVLPETVSEYTGLTDKNGKMIFKNDRARNGYTITYSDGNKSDFYDTGAILYDDKNGCYAINNGNDDYYNRLTIKMIVKHNIEVIGTVFDVEVENG